MDKIGTKWNMLAHSKYTLKMLTYLLAMHMKSFKYEAELMLGCKYAMKGVRSAAKEEQKY